MQRAAVTWAAQELSGIGQNSQIARGLRVPDTLIKEGSSTTAPPPARTFLLVAKEMGRGAPQAGDKGREKNVGRRGWAGSEYGQCPQAGRQGASPWQRSMLGRHPGRTTDSLPCHSPATGDSPCGGREESSAWSTVFLPLCPPEERELLDFGEWGGGREAVGFSGPMLDMAGCWRHLSQPWVQSKCCLASVKYFHLFYWPLQR